MKKTVPVQITPEQAEMLDAVTMGVHAQDLWYWQSSFEEMERALRHGGAQ